MLKETTIIMTFDVSIISFLFCYVWK